MSAPLTCGHHWEGTGVVYTVADEGEVRGLEVIYCASCGAIGRRVGLAFPCQGAETTAHRWEANERQERQARLGFNHWLAEHHPGSALVGVA